MFNRSWAFRTVRLFMIPLLLPGIGCNSATLTEIRGKTSFGPEFRNFGTNTHDIRYTAIQGVELKMSNDWIAGVSYQRRDLDDGAGDNENLVLFELGYPLWSTPKRPEQTTQRLQIDELEDELRKLGAEIAMAERLTNVETPPGLVQADEFHREP